MTRSGGSGRTGPFGEVRGGVAAPPGPPGDAAGDTPHRAPRPLIFSVTLTGIMANVLLAPAVPDVLAGLDVGEGRAGLLVAAAALPGIVVAPLIGLLADRFGRRALLVPCLVVFGVAGGLGAAAPSFEALLACRLLQGVGGAGLINLAVVLIGDGWDGPDRARVIGQNSAVLTASIALLPPLGGLLVDLGGWRATFVPYWLALLPAVAALVLLPRVPGRDVRAAEQVREALHHLRRPAVVASIATGVLAFLLVFGLFLTALPLHLERELGLGPVGRGIVLGLPAISSTAVALSLGRLTARAGVRPLVLLASGLLAAGFATVGLAPILAVLVLGTLVYGVGEGLVIPSLQSLVAGAAPATSRGAVVAVWTGGVRAGQSIGPLAAGLAVAATSTTTTFVMGAGLALVLLAAQVATGQPSD